MNARTRLAVCLSCLFLAAAAQAAEAQLSQVFGLTGITINSPSGVATPADTLTVKFSGVAGFSLIPENVFVVSPSPGNWEFVLTTPYDVGTAVPTPWSIQTTFGPLPAGVYDLFASGVTGFGTPSQFVIGRGQVFNAFVVTPEPAAAVLAATAAIGACRSRRE